MIKFIVKGQAKGKQRPGFNSHNKKAYTRQQTKDYEENIQIEYKRQCKNFRFNDDAPLRVMIIEYREIPKSTPKKLIKPMLENVIKPIHKIDVDNLAKIVLDGLNGIAYKDDAQIVELYIKKRYSQEPSIAVALEELKEESNKNE